jgi:hypothetical protein
MGKTAIVRAAAELVTCANHAMYLAAAVDRIMCVVMRAVGAGMTIERTATMCTVIHDNGAGEKA